MDLIKYEAAKTALAELAKVEDVQEFRNKAVAVEAYARQAKDYDLERDAAIARLRAERRCGELLQEMMKSKGGVPPKVVPIDPPEEKPKTLTEMGISRVQSSKWQKLAAVPEVIFDSVINDPVQKVTGAHILKAARPDADLSESTDLDAQWLWGRLFSMRRKNVFSRSVDEYLEALPEDLKPDAVQVINKLKKWVNG